MFQKACTRFVDGGAKVPIEIVYNDANLDVKEAKISLPPL